MSTRLPIRVARPQYRKCLLQRSTHRSFSATAPQLRKRGMMDQSLARLSLSSQKAKAPATLQDEAEQSGDAMADDLGVIPGTFIRLPWRDLPSILSAPKERLWYEWKWLRSRAQDPWSRLFYWLRLRDWGVKPRPNVRRKGVVKMAKKMHKEIYEAFARGDQKVISDRCLSGLSSQLISAMAQRSQNTILEWSRIKTHGENNPLYYIGLAGPRIVSDRALALPMENFKETGLRQVVVRLPTTQILRTTNKSHTGPKVRSHLARHPARQHGRKLAWTPDGEQPQATEVVNEQVGELRKEETKVEYLVLQKRTVRGVEEDWKVWGFAEATTPEKIEKDRIFLKQLEEFESGRTNLT